MQKRAQAALEFLMTYGWAILAAIVVIGVLAYFGVFSPGKYVPSACTLTAPLNCDEYSVSSEGDTNISLVIRNGIGDIINVTAIDIDSDTDCSWSGIQQINDSDTAQFATVCSLSKGSKYKGDIVVTYRKATGTLDQKATGSITGTVT